MKNQFRLALLCAAVASVPAFAQNTSDSRCGTTNYDRSRDVYTITNTSPGTVTQQCFITVVPKTAWTEGMPDLSTSRLVEGNYEITLSGGGGGGGGGAGGEREHGITDPGVGGSGGKGAVPVTVSRYLNPGVYRLTIGLGGRGGMAGSGSDMASGGGRGVDGGPTNLSDAYSDQTIAGFPGAESWNGTYPMVALGYAGGAQGATAQTGATGGGGSGGVSVGARGDPGGDGYIKLALKDPVPQAPVQVTPKAEPVAAPAPARPAKQDRN